jgi:voltage-gated potassium channel
MILGYGIIAVPTGIVTAEFSRKRKEKVNTQVCPDCTTEGHEVNAKFCKKCGAVLNP